MYNAVAVFPEMTLAAPVVVPPIVAPDPPTKTPYVVGIRRPGGIDPQPTAEHTVARAR